MIRLIKLAFLLRETSESAPKPSLYEFLPYHYGPYSFTLNHELRSIERDGWVRIIEGEVELLRSATSESSKLGHSFSLEIDALSRQYAKVSTSVLVAKVYKDYPWFTSRSKDESRRSTSVPASDCFVFTVGYEGLTIDGFLDLLLRSGLKRLIDVRCNAVARRFGFHRSTLERHCADVGIRYMHVPSLGIPSDKRTDLDSPEAYDRLFKHYEDEILSPQNQLLQLVSSLVTEEPSALMCMEANRKCCHRSRLGQAIASRTNLEVRELRNT